MDEREKEIREAHAGTGNDKCYLLSLIDQLRAEKDEQIKYNRKLGAENYDLKDQLDIETNLHDSMQDNLVNQHLEAEKVLHKQLDEIRKACREVLAFISVNDSGLFWHTQESMEALRKLAKLIKEKV